MPKEKSATRVLFWNTIGKFILTGLSFVTAPIFTRLLTPSDYGQFAVYSAWLSLVSLIMGLQTYGSIANAKIKYGDEHIDRYLSSIMTVSVFSFVIFLCLAVFLRDFFSRVLGLRKDLVVLLVVEGFASFCISFYVGKLVLYKQAEKSALISFIVSVSATVLSLVFLFQVLENRYIVKIYTQAIPKIIAGFVIVILIYVKGKSFFNLQYWKYCLALTVPLIFHGLGGLILSQSDRIMLQRFSGEMSVGIYSVAYTLAAVVSIIWGAFNTTWIPFYYEDKKNNVTEAILLRTKNYTIVFTIITIGFILLSPEVFKLMAPSNYWSGIQLVPLVAVAYYFNFLYAFPANFEFYNERTKWISLGTVCVAIINVVLNFLFIPQYGGIGAATATLISFFLLFVFHEIVARFVIRGYEITFRIYAIGIIPVGIISVLFYFTQDLWFVRWGIGLILGVYLGVRLYKKRAVF
jgi:O-antigen/teichoic acid export membrane protein